MVYLRRSISDCESVDQSVVMENSMNSIDPCVKSRHNNHVFKNKKTLNSPNSSKISGCGQCQNAVMDVVRLIVVVSACGFLFYPYIKFMLITSVQIVGEILCLVKEEVSLAPMIYGSLGLGILCSGFVVWGILTCIDRKCGNPNCKGLRKTAEFDIQLETEESLKNSNNLGREGVKKGLFELPRDHHRELEAELKKMAPSNGRAVLVFRARCGCCVGRMEIPGPKKPRKIKK